MKSEISFDTGLQVLMLLNYTRIENAHKLGLREKTFKFLLCIEASPSPGFNSRGGQKPEGGAKNQKGEPHLKKQYWVYAATGGPNVKWEATISNGGPGSTAPPV